MGVVFRARDHEGGADVAVKVLRDGQGEGDRFVREARVLAELHHPHVVRYIAHGETPEEEAYLVMEWIEGEDLSRRLARGRMRVEACVALGARVASALAEAHRRGVIHRDVKPSNLFLPGGDVAQVKVLDFGIARLAGMPRSTQTGAVLGTPGYMPPEQARGQGVLDPRADMFSLGCVLFECATGMPAFAGQHLPAVLAKILFEPAPRARGLIPEVPEALDDLLHRMLNKEAAERPDSEEVAAVLAGLERLAGEELGARVDRPPLSVPSLTSDEQRVLSVVMIGAPHAADAPAEPLDVEALRKIAHARGARLEHMADGSIAATLREALPPLDEAAQAARLARDLHLAARARPIAVATCRSGGLFKRTVGDAINRAVRLLDGVARLGVTPGAPLVDDVSARLLDQRFELRPQPPGFAIVGEIDPTAIERLLLGRNSPYVGRKAELGMLTTLLAQTIEDGVPHAALVTGPSGFGKSRLARELLRVARREAPEATVWTARGDALHSGSVFGMLADALRTAVGIRRGEPPANNRARLRQHVADRVPEPDRARVAEFLGELVGVPFPDDASPALWSARTDVRLMREQTMRAFADLLRAECAARPVVLVLDDLQWGDAASIRCVGMALATLKNTRLFVLGLARPEVSQVFPRLWEDEGVVNVRLRELTRKAGAELVEHALGARATPEVVERLVTQADGHTLYLEELIRAVAEGREDTSPETVLALMDARLSQLSPEARRVLRAASVFGDVCWSGGVAALVSDAVADTALRRLDELVKLEVLVRRPESRIPGQIEYAFQHALLREGAYAQLTDADRALGHRLAAEWLEARGEAGPLTLAEHWSRAGEGARAAELAYRAGNLESAIRHAKKGLSSELSGEARGALLGVLCEAHTWRSEWDLAAPLVDEALRLSRPGSTPWVHAATARVWLSVAQGAFDDVPAQVERLRETAVDPEATSLVGSSLGISVIALVQLGRFDLAETTLARFGDVVEPVLARDWALRGWYELARAHFEALASNDPYRGLGLARASSASFQDGAHPRGQPMARFLVGMCLWLLGAFEEADRALRGVGFDWELGEFALYRDYLLARVLIDRGQLDAARDAAGALLTRADQARSTRFSARSHGLLARLSFRAGDLDAAEREVALALAQMPSQVLDRGTIEIHAVALRLAQGRLEEALVLAEQVVAAAEAMRHNRVHARLVRAEALAAVGDREAADAAFVEARAMLLADAEKIGAPALKRSFLERVPEHARLLRLSFPDPPPREGP